MPIDRVVITGMGAVSPFGQGAEAMFLALLENKCATAYVENLEAVQGMSTRVACIAPDIDFSTIPRKNRRSMSKMGMMAMLAFQEAVEQSLITESLIHSEKTGLVFGSTIGSPFSLEDFFGQYIAEHSIEQIKSMVFFKVMSHSVAANLAQSMGIRGRVVAPAAACATGSQAIGLAYELIASGKQDIVFCGGSDEYHPLTSATFDMMQAASTQYNETPQCTPRPFDKARDGIVCSEGAGVLILESLTSAQKRRAPILAELVGFSTRSDPSSIATPFAEPLFQCMAEALEGNNIAPEAIDYVNAHATATIQGDIAEAQAIAALVGADTPVSSLKGHLGHTMAASGALETIACIQMLQYNILLGTRNLENPDPECRCIRLLQDHLRVPPETILKNSFALGGINCSLVLRKI